MARTTAPALTRSSAGRIRLSRPAIASNLGVGYETVQAMLQDVKFSLPLLLQLLFVKLAMTAISLGSGLVGGIFARRCFWELPWVRLWFLFGNAAGKRHRVAGAAYAMVGMAVSSRGSARAPLTAILLMFELTRDYRIVLPLMAAVGLSVWLVECVNRRSTAHSLNLQQMGVDVAVNTPIKAREQLQDWEDVLAIALTELISCQIPIDDEHATMSLCWRSLTHICRKMSNHYLKQNQQFDPDQIPLVRHKTDNIKAKSDNHDIYKPENRLRLQKNFRFLRKQRDSN